MRIGSLPRLPEVPNQGRGPLTTTVGYQAPQTRKTKLGAVPEDYHSGARGDYPDYTSCQQGACDIEGREIWVDQPVLDGSGQPMMHRVEKNFEVEAQPVWQGAVSWGSIGMALGAVAGAAAGSFVGGHILAGAAVLGTTGAVIGGLWGGHQASQDRIRLEWQERPIDELRLEGYRHDATSTYMTQFIQIGKVTTTIQHHTGYNHDFDEDIEGTQRGTYFEPVVVHYKA